jgi:hypothetical protein
MNRQTKRRAFLGGAVATAVGGASYLLNRSGGRDRGRWLRPVESLADSPAFAYVSAAIDRNGRVDADVAMRERSESAREITLFADTDRPVGAYMPPLRSFWRFEASGSDRSTGRYELRVGDATLPVELVADAPPRSGAGVELTPRVTWRSDYVAHARGYDTGDGGRLHVAFRRQTGDGPTLDELAFRDPDGRIVGRRSVPGGVRELAMDLPSLTVHDADAELVGFVDGREVDAVPMFYR